MPEAGKKYVYGLYLDKNSEYIDGLYETDSEDILSVSEYFIQFYDLTVDAMQNAVVKLISVQNDNLPEITEKDDNVNNKPTTHYAFRSPYFNDDGAFSHYVTPICETVPDFDEQDNRFSIMFDTPEDAIGFITEQGMLPEAEDNEWLLVRVVETPIKRC